MFAPYCRTCRARVLLGFSRIVASHFEQGGSIHLRCVCGTIVAADAARPPRHLRFTPGVPPANDTPESTGDEPSAA